MKKIVRLTESDLARIVRRVISEGAIKIGKQFTVGGETYQGTIGQGATGKIVFYWNEKLAKRAMGTTVDKLNKLSGYNIPAANGELSVLYIQKNPQFKTTLRGLV